MSRASESSPTTAVVVLTYGGYEDTERCLASLADSASCDDITVVVVDNASTDGTPGLVAGTFPWVVLIRLEHNRGFAAGNNVGIEWALDRGFDYVLLLNNDTIVPPQGVEQLVTAALELPDAGAVCPVLAFADQPAVAWYAGATFDPNRIRAGRVDGYREPLPGPGPPQRTDRATGAALLVPLEVVRRLGALDERYFFLYEDVDWSLRMRAEGYANYVVPNVVVLHAIASTQGGEHSSSSFYYGVRNRMLLTRDHAAGGLPRRLLEVGILALYLARCRRAPSPAKAVGSVLAGWRDYRRAQFGPQLNG